MWGGLGSRGGCGGVFISGQGTKPVSAVWRPAILFFFFRFNFPQTQPISKMYFVPCVCNDLFYVRTFLFWTHTHHKRNNTQIRNHSLIHLRGQTGSSYHPLGGSQDHKSSKVVLNLQPTQENWHTICSMKGFIPYWDFFCTSQEW